MIWENSKKIYYYSDDVELKNFEKKKIKIPVFDFFKDNSFIDTSKISKIDNMKYNIIFHDNDHFISFYFNSMSDLSEIKKMVKYCFAVIYFLANNDTLKCYIYFSSLKKEIDTDILKPNNINSGLTNFTQNYVLIWRYEEWLRVYFHELIHFFNRDAPENNKFDDSKKHFENWCIETDEILLNEAITDYWALILNTSLVSYVLNINFGLLLNQEKKFVYKQCKKILSHYEMNTTKDLTKKCDKKIKQTTNAFSYYIVKSCLFFYDDEFMSKAYIDNDIRKPNVKYFNNEFINDVKKWILSDDFNELLLNENVDLNDKNLKMSSLTIG